MKSFNTYIKESGLMHMVTGTNDMDGAHAISGDSDMVSMPKSDLIRWSEALMKAIQDYTDPSSRRIGLKAVLELRQRLNQKDRDNFYHDRPAALQSGFPRKA